MKSLTQHISQVKTLHSLNEFINEKLIVNKNYNGFKRDTIKVDDENLYDTVLKETAKQLEKANN